MEKEIFIKMAEIEKEHWWFQGRRRIAREFISKLDLPKNAKILEVGCGTGGNLPLLMEFGEVSACEPDPLAFEVASVNKVILKQGCLPNDIPFAENQFDLVVLFDVLEHVDDDLASLNFLSRLLKVDGHMLLTVPALPSLWSRHDECHHHKRRYLARELRERVLNAKLGIIKLTYFNFFLFPLIFLGRIFEKLFYKKSHVSLGLSLPAKPINSLLQFVFASERYWLRSGQFPVGVSLLCLLKKEQ